MIAFVPSLNLKLRLPSITRLASKHLDLTAMRLALPRGLLSVDVGKVPTDIGSLKCKDFVYYFFSPELHLKIYNLRNFIA